MKKQPESGKTLSGCPKAVLGIKKAVATAEPALQVLFDNFRLLVEQLSGGGSGGIEQGVVLRQLGKA